jgi:hypothetical protein
MDTRKRISRWTTRQPEHPPYRLESGDFEILKCLGRYTLATNREIAALTNRSYKVICRRTQKLKNWYIKVCSAQLNNTRLYQRLPQAFHLTPRGISKLAEIGIEVDIPSGRCAEPRARRRSNVASARWPSAHALVLFAPSKKVDLSIRPLTVDESSEGRCREMVADHQGIGDQGRVIRKSVENPD